ncbi:MAG: hypothetical protein H6835_07480 [Planctomycetes bacterium]|nr:hypothetical protein [Planctomycetota bacterium]
MKNPIGKCRWRGRLVVGLIAMLPSLGSCGATPATTEMTTQEERRLLAPFLAQRLVVCDELVVDMSGNFDKCVTTPGVDRELHRFDVREQDGVIEKVWTNITGLQAGWFSITIREAPAPDDVSGKLGPHTTYKVLNRFTRRTRGGTMGLSAVATGEQVLVEETRGQVQKLREFTIADGVVRR